MQQAIYLPCHHPPIYQRHGKRSGATDTLKIKHSFQEKSVRQLAVPMPDICAVLIESSTLRPDMVRLELVAVCGGCSVIVIFAC